MFRRAMRRRMRRRVIIGGALLVGGAAAMVKLSHEDAQKIQQTTGKAPEDMDEAELQAAMAQAGVQGQPITAEDQAAMAQAEADDPGD
jgi:hypothetical protein